MLPRKKVTEEQIDSDPELQQLLRAGWTRQELLNGHDGEKYWHDLSQTLKSQWRAFVDDYRRDNELDGPCFWFDQKTRKCKHHDFRPKVCRDFEIGSKLCHQWRIHYRELIENQAAISLGVTTSRERL